MYGFAGRLDEVHTPGFSPLEVAEIVMLLPNYQRL